MADIKTIHLTFKSPISTVIYELKVNDESFNTTFHLFLNYGWEIGEGRGRILNLIDFSCNSQGN